MMIVDNRMIVTRIYMEWQRGSACDFTSEYHQVQLRKNIMAAKISLLTKAMPI